MKLKLAQILLKIAFNLLGEEEAINFTSRVLFPGKFVAISVADSEEELLGSNLPIEEESTFDDYEEEFTNASINDKLIQ